MRYVHKPSIQSTVFAPLGFLILPIILVTLSWLANIAAPAKLQFPKPLLVFGEVVRSLAEPKVLSAIEATLFTLGQALIISLLLGVTVGLFLGLSKYVWNLSQPTIDFFRSIPVTFLIPGSALLMGVSSPHIIWVLATYPCFLILVFNVRAGISKQEPERVHSFYIISGSTNLVRRFLKVTFFEILPDIFAGFRIALSYGLVIVTVLEYMKLGKSDGIGSLIYDELNALNYVRVYALTFMVGGLGFALNKLVEMLQNMLVHWSDEKL